MFRKLFIEHPSSVGETYFQHMSHALSFSVTMFLGAFACLIHAIIPGLCVRTGSNRITLLHDRMVVNRDQLTSARER